MTDQPRQATSDTAATAEGDAPQPPETPRPLPEAPLFAMLGTVEQQIGPTRIDQVWLFPPRRLKAGETAVAVVAAFLEEDSPDRRRVLAAHYTAPADPGTTPRIALDEYGIAPTQRIGRVVEDVVERIKDAPPEAPRAYAIRGERERWDRLLHELAEAFLQEAAADPRLRR